MEVSHIFPTNYKFYFPENVNVLGIYTNTIYVLSAAREWFIEF